MNLNIEELLFNKDFSDLSSNEKEFVLSEVTKEEYDDIRFMISNTNKSFKKDIEELRLDDRTRINLLTTFKQKHTRQEKFTNPKNLWENYKYFLKPSLSLGVLVIGIFMAIHLFSKNKNPSTKSISEVNLFLNENKSLMKINKKHSSELVDSNQFHKDSLIEMNNYLQIQTEGLYVN